MVKAQLIWTCAFVLLLIFSIGIISTEERLLTKRSSINYCTKCRSHNQILKPLASEDQAMVDDQFVTDFRPTTPGHSPGVGHATGPAASTGPEP